MERVNSKNNYLISVSINLLEEKHSSLIDHQTNLFYPKGRTAAWDGCMRFVYMYTGLGCIVKVSFRKMDKGGGQNNT